MQKSLHQKFLHCCQLLGRYAPLWSEEILYTYPEGMKDYPTDIVEFFDSLSLEELFQIDALKITNHPRMPQLLKNIYQEIEEIFTLPVYEHDQAINHPFKKIKGKKDHEIKIILSSLQNFHFDKFYEFCGGIGHLSQIVSHLFHCPSTSLDIDKNLQDSGAHRYRFFESAKNVHYENTDVYLFQEDQKDLGQNPFSVGLHTCGGLSFAHFQFCIKNKIPLLNFGCCYYKVYEKKLYNLSQFAKKNGLQHLTLMGLTLATRSHAKSSRRDFDFKWRVKSYRYTFHLFYFDRYQNWNYPDLGNTHPRDYQMSFAHYARMQMEKLQLKHQAISDEEFNTFFEKTEIKSTVERMIRLGIFRAEFGKVLEIYLLLDRLFYLGEQGMKATIAKYFDMDLSPRNIGILALP